MGAALSLCGSWDPEELFLQKMLKRNAKLSLAIANVYEPPSSASRTLFSPAEKIEEAWIETLEVAKQWAPLSWRFGTSSASGMRFWRAKVATILSNGDLRSHWCLLQVPAAPGDRTMENAILNRRDALKVAAYAEGFNQHIRGPEAGEALDDSPAVSVCIPTVCKVLHSPILQYFAWGDILLLLPYTLSEVIKFVFDGSEDFLEIPHAFFHYVTWSSGGNESISDLQGAEEDTGEVLLVNPCISRPLAFGTGFPFDHLNRGPSQMDLAFRPPDPSRQMFDMLHPRCGPLCKTFDPERRVQPVRRHGCIPVSCNHF